MPNCNAHFPNRLKIEGKMRNLNNRKYCFECSPWKSHNTIPFHYVDGAKINLKTGRRP